MKRTTTTIGLLTLLLVALAGVSVQAQTIVREDDRAEYGYAKIDRHLDVEVWTDHSDGEYYEGDRITIYFRASQDAFVSIYSVDTRGKVNLLFPSDPTEDNFIRGGVNYSIPGKDDDFDFVVDGPEGVEHLQMIGSRERFPIPNWYRNSGIVCDWDDRAEFMDALNNEHFVRYGGQRFAYDRAVVFVDQWEPDYYRPVYDPYYPSWTACGNVYIDYPWGATIYVNGIYWGIAPLYVPRIAVGWHTITIYDRWGHCWEDDFHVSRYNTVVFNNTIVRPRANVFSRYKDVRQVGYRNPVNHGYPAYKTKDVVVTNTVTGKKDVVSRNKVVGASAGDNIVSLSKKHVRGSSTLRKTDRGYETDVASKVTTRNKSRGETTSITSSRTKTLSGDDDNVVRTRTSRITRDKTKKGTAGSVGQGSTSRQESGSGDYYERRTGSRGSSKGVTTSKEKSSSEKSNTVRQKSTTTSKSSESKSSGAKSVQKQSSSSKSSGSSSGSKSSGDKSSGGSKKKK
ncbi:MAG: DUF4384 domain-containing protein [candidate division Zixibacteria bacterium]|nr:DUF4384 domain-containing protein [candidate division Zixibacteria bacterium]